MSRMGNPFHLVVTSSPDEERTVPLVSRVNASAWSSIERALQLLFSKNQEPKIPYIIGNVGSGKTTLLQRLRIEASDRGYHFAYVEPFPSRVHLFAQLTGHVVRSLDRNVSSMSAAAEGKDAWSPLDTLSDDPDPTPLMEIGIRCLRKGMEYLARRQGQWSQCFREEEVVVEKDILLDESRCSSSMFRQESWRLNQDYVCASGLAALSRSLSDVSGHVIQMLAKLCFDETEAAARRWLRGEGLSEDDLSVLGLPEGLQGDLVGQEVLKSISNLLDRPMVVALDELEASLKSLGPDGMVDLFNILRVISNNMGQRVLLVLCSQALVAEALIGLDQPFQDRLLGQKPILLRGLEVPEARALLDALAPHMSVTDTQIEDCLRKHYSPRAFMRQIAGLWIDKEITEAPQPSDYEQEAEDAPSDTPPVPSVDPEQILRKHLDSCHARTNGAPETETEACFRGAIRLLLTEIDPPFDCAGVQENWYPDWAQEKTSADFRISSSHSGNAKVFGLQVALVANRMHREIDRIQPISGEFDTVIIARCEESKRLQKSKKKYVDAKRRLKSKCSGRIMEIQISRDHQKVIASVYKLWQDIELGKIDVSDEEIASVRDVLPNFVFNHVNSGEDAAWSRIKRSISDAGSTDIANDGPALEDDLNDTGHIDAGQSSDRGAFESIGTRSVCMTKEFFREAKTSGVLHLDEEVSSGHLCRTTDQKGSEFLFSKRDTAGPLRDLSKGELRRMGVPDSILVLISDVHVIEDLEDLDLQKDTRQRLEIKILERIAKKRAVSMEHAEHQVNGIVSDMLELDERQWSLVNAELDKPLLIRGVAGSGKTQILFHAACKHAYDSPPKSTLLLTYNRALAELAQSSLSRLLGPRSSRVEVFNYDRWCKNYLGVKSEILDLDERDSTIARFMDDSRVKVREEISGDSAMWGYETKWWLDEIKMILDQPIESKDDYMQFLRRGRGVRLDKQLRPAAWAVYRHFCETLDRSGLLTWHTLRYKAYRKLINDDTQIYDEVLIDEGQDLPPVMLQVASRLASDGNLTISVDGAQNIYRPGFSWKRMGIDFKSRRGLRKNYRSTVQILGAAEPFRPAEEEEPLRSESLEEARQGPIPKVVLLQDGLEAPWIVRDLRRRLEKTPMDLGKVAILVYGKKNTPAAIWKCLVDSGFEATLIKSGEKGRSRVDFSDARIKVVPVMSSKGLDFRLVYLAPVGRLFYDVPPYSTDKEGEQRHSELMRRVFYVALTRSMDDLVIVTKSGGASMLLSEFKEGSVEYVYSEGTAGLVPSVPVTKRAGGAKQPGEKHKTAVFGIYGSGVYHCDRKCRGLRNALSEPLQYSNVEAAAVSGHVRPCGWCGKK